MSWLVRRAGRVQVGLLALVLLGVVAQAAEQRYDFQRFTLDNGLTVVSLEDHSCPTVAVQVWYHVGSKNEDSERQGFAHMFEHMMFRGTEVLPPEKFDDYVRQCGGDSNAYTSFDNTTYVMQLPSNQLEMALWLEAERMAFLKIDDEGFYTERNVVEEERRMSSLNTPYGTVAEKLLPVLFKEHPYRWTPIGQIPHLRAATIDELQAFWDRFYVPANATLVVVGDVRHGQVKDMAQKYFGWIPKMPAPKPLDIKEPPQTEPRRVTIPEKKGPVPIVGLVYRTVGSGHPDEVPLGMLMTILGGGESSRLYKDIVKEQKLAEVAMAGAFALQDEGLAGAGAVMLPLKDKQKVIDEIRAHIERVKQEGVTERELEKVKNQALRDKVTEALSVEGKASLLGHYQTLEGDAEKANQQLAQIRAVTVDDLKRVANTYLVKERETLAIVEPQVGGALKSLLGLGKEEDVDEGAAPLPPPEQNRVAKRGGARADLTRPAQFPDKPPVAALLEAIPDIPTREMKLDNGLHVVVVPNHEVPFVTLTLGLLNGAWTETKSGTALMAAQMITKGSAHHSAAEMAEELEFQAIELGGSASADVGGVSASCVTDKLDLAVKLMAEVVRTPTFPQDEFDILRNQTLMGLMVQAQQAEYVAARELRQRVFGSHPYSRTPTGEPEDVQALTTADLKQWWGTYVRPDAAVMYVAGDVEPDAAVAAVRKHFGDWKAEGPAPVVKLPPIPTAGATQIYLVDRPGSVQSQIRVGHVSITRKDPDFFRARLLSQIFGGSFNSRLNKALRVDRGLTYGANGGVSASRFAGNFTISTFTKTPKTPEAIEVILQEIDRIQASPVEADELHIAQSYTVGSFAGDRETPQATVGDLWLIRYAGLPTDYLKQYLAGVKAATADDLLATAQRVIQRQNLTIVVVGEAKDLKEPLEKIAPVTVVPAAGAPPAEDEAGKLKEAA
ncbi:MAG TPA: pitrilysin family protein [Phycisphaerae bacterium]|nr:pitrilysin family protein [Phycisphaerae bacterium]HNU43966.1 pitrilysin family protein [Phycisphaerae bacterium]